MASKRTLTHRFFNACKASKRLLFNHSAVCRTNITNNVALDPGDHGIFGRFLHPRPSFPPPTTLTGSVRPMAVGLGNVMEQLAGVGERIVLDGLRPPETNGLTVEETRKLVRLAEVVRLKKKLKKIPKSWITYQEFVRICEEDCLDGDEDYGLDLAKRLDDSGAVIVLGNVVFLDPEQMAKSIAGMIPRAGMKKEDQKMRAELEELEKQKAMMDGEADRQVRRELWLGLGFVIAQTAALMRLTFWELTWDVMEPICYFITSTYFMGGYAFFLTTSKEPSFQALYHSRFVAKQSRLMKLHNFDVHTYNRLRRHSTHQLPPFV